MRHQVQISLRNVLVIFLGVSLVCVCISINRRRHSILQEWQHLGGGTEKIIVPAFRWNFAWIGGSKDGPKTLTVEELNHGFRSVTSISPHITLRVNASLRLQLNMSGDDCAILCRILEGVSANELELVDWNVNDCDLSRIRRQFKSISVKFSSIKESKSVHQ